jgi:uncharacterized protein YjiS (DUF1127 family)
MATLTIDFPRSAVESVERMRYLTGNAARKDVAPATTTSLFEDIRAWFDRRAEHAEEMRTLGRMTDRQLIDIGMTRGDVRRLTR